MRLDQRRVELVVVRVDEGLSSLEAASSSEEEEDCAPGGTRSGAV